MYAHYHKSYKDSQTMTLVRKLRVHPCSKSLLEVESKECMWQCHMSRPLLSPSQLLQLLLLVIHCVL